MFSRQPNGRLELIFTLLKVFADDGFVFVVVKRGFWMISSLSSESCKMRTTQISCLKWCLSSSTILRNSSTIWPKLCKNLSPFNPCLAAKKISVHFLNRLSFGNKRSPIVHSARIRRSVKMKIPNCFICAVNNRLLNSNRWMPMSTNSRAVVPGNYRFLFRFQFFLIVVSFTDS